MPINPARLFDAQYDFERLLSQSQALVHTLIIDDHFQNLSRDHLAAALCLLSDRLQDLKTSQEKIAKELRHA